MRRRSLEIAVLALLVVLAGVDRPDVAMPALPDVTRDLHARTIDSIADVGAVAIDIAAHWAIDRIR